jgi:uncharacterized protein YbbK (DUF523 family)
MELILVSACLLGSPVRYNGSDASPRNSLLDQWVREGRVVSVCPEVAAGMPVPSPPAEIERGMGGLRVLSADARVRENSGKDVTNEFVAGAHHSLRIAAERHIRIAVLKEGSPSCGVNFTYDGSFSGTEVPQLGVTAALLRKSGLYVFSENQLSEAAEAIERLEAASAA